MKLEQPGYNCVSESSFKESNTWAWWTLSPPISRIMSSMHMVSLEHHHAKSTLYSSSRNHHKEHALVSTQY